MEQKIQKNAILNLTIGLEGSFWLVLVVGRLRKKIEVWFSHFCEKFFIQSQQNDDRNILYEAEFFISKNCGRYFFLRFILINSSFSDLRNKFEDYFQSFFQNSPTHGFS